MSDPLHEGLASEIQKLAPSAIIELFVLDATSLGSEVLRFHAGTNQLRQNIVWQGETYVRFPVVASGFEYQGQGQIPRPKLQVSNILSAITALLLELNDLQGAKVIRKRTMAKYLDAVNFTDSVNATEDPTAEFAEDIYFIDRKSSEDRDIVEFELAASIDVAGVLLPRRQIIQNVCTWLYRGAECGYAGPIAYDQNDEPISTEDLSGSSIAYLNALNNYNAKKALTASAQSVMSAAAASKDTACSPQRVETRYDINTYFVRVDMQIGYPDTAVVRGYWNNVQVTVGSTYRRGALMIESVSAGYSHNVYRIERWETDSIACAAETSPYNTAQSNLSDALAAEASALSDLQNAYDALPSNDPLKLQDRCGKRLSSCKLRFGEDAPLPFGSFPSAGLIK